MPVPHHDGGGWPGRAEVRYRGSAHCRVGGRGAKPRSMSPMDTHPINVRPLTLLVAVLLSSLALASPLGAPATGSPATPQIVEPQAHGARATASAASSAHTGLRAARVGRREPRRVQGQGDLQGSRIPSQGLRRSPSAMARASASSSRGTARPTPGRLQRAAVTLVPACTPRRSAPRVRRPWCSRATGRSMRRSAPTAPTSRKVGRFRPAIHAPAQMCRPSFSSTTHRRRLRA